MLGITVVLPPGCTGSVKAVHFTQSCIHLSKAYLIYPHPFLCSVCSTTNCWQNPKQPTSWGQSKLCLLLTCPWVESDHGHHSRPLPALSLCLTQRYSPSLTRIPAWFKVSLTQRPFPPADKQLSIQSMELFLPCFLLCFVGWGLHPAFYPSISRYRLQLRCLLIFFWISCPIYFFFSAVFIYSRQGLYLMSIQQNRRLQGPGCGTENRLLRDRTRSNKSKLKGEI